MKAFKAKEVMRNVPIGAPVAVKLNHSDYLEKNLRGTTILGFWRGVKANPKINHALLNQLDGMHWIAEVADPESDDLIHDIHLELIEQIDIAYVEDVRPG